MAVNWVRGCRSGGGGQLLAPTPDLPAGPGKGWGPEKSGLGCAHMGLFSMVGCLGNTCGKGTKGPLAENGTMLS